MAAPTYTPLPTAPARTMTPTVFAAAADAFVAALAVLQTEGDALGAYTEEQAAIALAAALGGDLPPLTGHALKLLRVNAGETAAEFVAAPSTATETVEGLVEKATTAEAEAGTTGDKFMDDVLTKAAIDKQVPDIFSATGSAPMFACRAWVNFDGTGTVAIRASGNVSSITDNGTGDYAVNFTTNMPDVDYMVSGTSEKSGLRVSPTVAQTVSAVRVNANDSNSSDVDAEKCNVIIVR